MYYVCTNFWYYLILAQRFYKRNIKPGKSRKFLLWQSQHFQVNRSLLRFPKPFSPAEFLFRVLYSIFNTILYYVTAEWGLCLFLYFLCSISGRWAQVVKQTCKNRNEINSSSNSSAFSASLKSKNNFTKKSKIKCNFEYFVKIWIFTKFLSSFDKRWFDNFQYCDNIYLWHFL